MILVAIHLHACNDLLNDTIHAYIKIALATYGVEEFLIVTLAILDERSQQINLFAHEVLEEKIQNLLLSILHHPFTRSEECSHGTSNDGYRDVCA